jgi:hypothetical protein
MLDLRQPKTADDSDLYRYGWLDTDHRILYANFNLLVEFVQKEMKQLYYPSEEEIAKESNPECAEILQQQRDNYIAIAKLYSYWTVERPILHKAKEMASTDWYRAHTAAKGEKTEEVECLWQELQAAQERCDKTETQALHDLIDLRHYLWS